MEQIAVYGASGYGREVMPLARQSLRAKAGGYRLVFVDDAPSAAELNGHPVMTYAEWLEQEATDRSLSIAIGNGEIRQRIHDRCAADGVGFIELRAGNVVQFDDVDIGEGAILNPFVTLTSNIRIGRHFHANIYSYVAHDCVIGDFVTFAPGVHCNGNVHIEDFAYLGTGAIIRQGQPGRPLRIGRGAVVGMGAVVTKDVPPGVTVVGNPARILAKR